MMIETMSRSQIESFTRKLETFDATLSRKEGDLLRAILMRAGEGNAEDVEGHGLSRSSIATLVLMAASATGAIGVTVVQAGPTSHVAPAPSVHHVVSVVGDDKGGSETITYSSGVSPDSH